MGFPVVGCCADLALPPFLVYLVLFLGYFRRAIAWCLSAAGLGDLLDADEFPGDLTSPSTSAHALHSAAAGASGSLHLPHPVRPRPRCLPASLIREALPTSTYDPCDDSDSDSESCAVCLYGLEPGDKVRRLGGCRHVFHSCCIDPWVDLGRRTCPLCRATLVPEELRDSLLMSDMWTDSLSAASYPGELYLADDGDYYPTIQDDDDGDFYSQLLDNDDLSLGLPPIQHSRDTEFLTWPTLHDTSAAATAASD